jgi:hypothetical protein
MRGSEHTVDPKTAERARAILGARLPRWLVSVGRGQGPVPTWVLALAFYFLMGLFTIGRHALGHPGTVCACTGGADPAAYMWALSWWPHAIAHGLNPFVTHYQWSPTGVNVVQGAMIPTAALVMAPVTALAGPVVSYNVLSLGSVTLSALTAYLLCRRLVRRELPAIVGGYLFGFSSYNFGQLTGHLNLTLIFLLPVMVHVALRRKDNELSGRTYAILMALVFVLQAGLSTELLAESLGFGAVILICARFLTQEAQRSRIDRLIVETVGAGVLALVIGSPFFYYALVSGGFPRGVADYWNMYAMDLLNPLFPTEATWLGHREFQSLSAKYASGGVTGEDGYLSIPLLVAFVIWGFSERRRILTKLVLIVAALSFIAALGAHLHIAGRQTVALPFSWVKHLPIFNDLLPERIVVFTSLAVAIGIAVWLARPAGRVVGRWFVVILAVVMLFPNITKSLYGVPPDNPRFFSTATYRHYLSPGETVLILPFGASDVSTLWQAETGFHFYMPEGYVGQVPPPPFSTEATTAQLVSNAIPSASSLVSFIRRHYVSHIVVDMAVQNAWRSLLASMGLHSEQVGGVLLYSVSGALRPSRHAARAPRSGSRAEPSRNRS